MRKLSCRSSRLPNNCLRNFKIVAVKKLCFVFLCSLFFSTQSTTATSCLLLFGNASPIVFPKFPLLDHGTTRLESAALTEQYKAAPRVFIEASGEKHNYRGSRQEDTTNEKIFVALERFNSHLPGKEKNEAMLTALAWGLGYMPSPVHAALVTGGSQLFTALPFSVDGTPGYRLVSKYQIQNEYIVPETGETIPKRAVLTAINIHKPNGSIEEFHIKGDGTLTDGQMIAYTSKSIKNNPFKFAPIIYKEISGSILDQYLDFTRRFFDNSGYNYDFSPDYTALQRLTCYQDLKDLSRKIDKDIAARNKKRRRGGISISETKIEVKLADFDSESATLSENQNMLVHMVRGLGDMPSPVNGTLVNQKTKLFMAIPFKVKDDPRYRLVAEYDVKNESIDRDTGKVTEAYAVLNSIKLATPIHLQRDEYLRENLLEVEFEINKSGDTVSLYSEKLGEDVVFSATPMLFKEINGPILDQYFNFTKMFFKRSGILHDMSPLHRYIELQRVEDYKSYVTLKRKFRNKNTRNRIYLGIFIVATYTVLRFVGNLLVDGGGLLIKHSEDAFLNKKPAATQIAEVPKNSFTYLEHNGNIVQFKMVLDKKNNRVLFQTDYFKDNSPELLDCAVPTFATSSLPTELLESSTASLTLKRLKNGLYKVSQPEGETQVEAQEQFIEGDFGERQLRTDLPLQKTGT